jgi:hypothetical protein
MNTAETERTDTAAQNETFVIAKTDDGFRVCSPLAPAKQYVVSGLPDDPRCTCPEFVHNEGDPAWYCKHILAVLKQNGEPAPASANAPVGVTTELAPRPEKKNAKNNGNGAVMLLKRSVSPDGRIDSLSVEFSCPVGKGNAEELKQRAERILALQADIAAGFLKTGGNGKPQREADAANAIPAQLLAVASMNSRFGLRRFINVLANGQVLKLFGSEKQLAEAVSAAGYPSVAEHLADGMVLNLPCGVVTKPSADGKYINVERVLPAPAAAQK